MCTSQPVDLLAVVVVAVGLAQMPATQRRVAAVVEADCSLGYNLASVNNAYLAVEQKTVHFDMPSRQAREAGGMVGMGFVVVGAARGA